MDVTITKQQLKRLRRAADITEIQQLMAKYVTRISQMDVSEVYADLFSQKNSDVSIELGEFGGYDGPEQVKAFLNAYDEYLSDPTDKRGWMELQHICNPLVLVAENRKTAQGAWSILAPSSKLAVPYPCDSEKLTAYWGCGKYLVDFVKENDQWKILKLRQVWFLRSPFEIGWMKQADCIHSPVLKGVKPDRPASSYNVYNADYTCANGGLEWGPYLDGLK